VLVARDDPPGSGGQRALYDPIVVRVLFDTSTVRDGEMIQA
jgi:hypothetical protein